MFVQVIQGKVSDHAAARERLESWVRELSPGADGWLGSTAGVTDSGDLVVLARFESEQAARRNSDRPEQSEWWATTAALFSEEPTFLDSTAVEVDTSGDPDGAGFVQVMQGATSNPERARELMAADPTDWASFRPEILGSLTAYHPDGAWTMAIYFTSEDEAREGERKAPPPELARVMEELDSLAVGEPVFLDLRDPWLHSPSHGR
jgi:hypothetical protein